MRNCSTSNLLVYLQTVNGCVYKLSQYVQNKTIQRIKNHSRINIANTLLRYYFRRTRHVYVQVCGEMLSFDDNLF
jgi:arginyl-tRNA--protein-N-Asp/Glu arginylyltransferase